MRIKKQLIADVGFTEEEIKSNEIKQVDSNITWHPDSPTKDITVGEEARKMLIQALESSEHLHEGYLPLYDRLKDGADAA